MSEAVKQLMEEGLAFGMIQDTLKNDGYLRNIYEKLEKRGFAREKAKYYIDLYKKKHEGLRIRPGYNNAMYNAISSSISLYVFERAGREWIVAEIAREYGISKEKAEERVACWKGRGRMLAGVKSPDHDIQRAISYYLAESGSHEMDIIEKLEVQHGCSKRQARDAIGKYLAEHPDIQIMPGYRKDYEQKKEAFKLIDVLKEFITSQAEMIHWIVNKVKCTAQMASAYLDEYQQEFGAIPGLC